MSSEGRLCEGTAATLATCRRPRTEAGLEIARMPEGLAARASFMVGRGVKLVKERNFTSAIG